MNRFVIAGSLLILILTVGSVGSAAQGPAELVVQEADVGHAHWLVRALEGDRTVLADHVDASGTCFAKSELGGGVTSAGCSEWGTWDANGDCGGVATACCDRGKLAK